MLTICNSFLHPTHHPSPNPQWLKLPTAELPFPPLPFPFHKDLVLKVTLPNSCEATSWIELTFVEYSDTLLFISLNKQDISCLLATVVSLFIFAYLAPLVEEMFKTCFPKWFYFKEITLEVQTGDIESLVWDFSPFSLWEYWSNWLIITHLSW